MSEDEWQRLQVVVLGPGRPREGHPPYLYFQRRLGAAAATRLVAVENVSESAAGLDGLAAAITDRKAAAAFFGDAARLENGLLRDATLRQLEQLLPQ